MLTRLIASIQQRSAFRSTARYVDEVQAVRLPSSASSPASPALSCSAAANVTALNVPMRQVEMSSNTVGRLSGQSEIDAAYLPPEIWGEVFRFSSRADLLNLRATNREWQNLAEREINAITLQGPAAIVAFAESDAFAYVKTLRVSYPDNESLSALITSLRTLSTTRAMLPESLSPSFPASLSFDPSRTFLSASSQRSPVALEIVDSYERIGTRVLDMLNGISLDSLRITGALYEDTEAFRALQRCPFPLELDGYFSEEAMRTVAHMPTLRNLVVHARGLNDTIVSRFSAHAALRSIDFYATTGFTSRGLMYLMTIPGLESLRVQYAGPINQIDDDAARAMAGHETLEALHIIQHMPFQRNRIAVFSDEGLTALSKSRTLTQLSMPTSARMHAITNLTSLTQLTLSGGVDDAFPIDAHFVSCLCRMPTLQTLWIDSSHFEDDALRTLLAHIKVRTLHVKIAGDIARAEMDAILGNAVVQALFIDRGMTHAVSQANRSVLVTHPSLEQLRIGNDVYRRVPDACLTRF